MIQWSSSVTATIYKKMAGVAGRSGRPALAKPNSPQNGPINAIEVQPSGKLRPLTYWGGKGG
jgi:hypothetical protein